MTAAASASLTTLKATVLYQAAAPIRVTNVKIEVIRNTTPNIQLTNAKLEVLRSNSTGGTFATVEVPDSAAGTGTETTLATLGPTEAHDVSSITGGPVISIYFADTEGGDTPLIGADVIINVQFGDIELLDVSAIAGDVIIAGTFSPTEHSDVFGFSVAAAWFITLAIVDDVDTFDFEPPGIDFTTITAAEGGDAAVMTGTVTTLVAVAITEEADLPVMEGDVILVGAAAATESADAASVEGDVVVSGDEAVTEDVDTTAFAGGPYWSASFGVTEAYDAISYRIILGTGIAALEQNDLSTFTLTTYFSGTMGAVEGHDVASVSNQPISVGTWASGEVADHLSASGGQLWIGALGASEAADRPSFVYTVTSGTFSTNEVSDSTFFTNGVLVSVAVTEGLGVDDLPLPGAGQSIEVDESLHMRVSGESLTAIYATSIIARGGAVRMQEVWSPKWSILEVIADILRLSPSLSPTFKYSLTSAEHARIADVLSKAFPTMMAGGVSLSEVVNAAYGLLVLEKLKLTDLVGGAAQYSMVMAQSVRLSSALGRFIGAHANAGNIGAHDVPSGLLTSHPVMVDGLTIADVLHRSLLVRMTVPEGVEIADADVLRAIYGMDYAESVSFGAAYVAPNGSVTTWTVNTRTGAVTEYADYNFNSFAKLGDRYIGASDTGLYELDGPTDNGSLIIADILGGYAQFGGSRYSSLRAVYLGVRGGGRFALRIIEGDGTTRVYNVDAQSMRTTRIDIGKGLRSRYFAYELTSTGQDFDLDSIEFVPIVLTRRV